MNGRASAYHIFRSMSKGRNTEFENRRRSIGDCATVGGCCRGFAAISAPPSAQLPDPEAGFLPISICELRDLSERQIGVLIVNQKPRDGGS